MDGNGDRNGDRHGDRDVNGDGDGNKYMQNVVNLAVIFVL